MAFARDGIAVAVLTSVNGNVVSLVPAALLTEFTTNYQLTLTRDIRSVAGNRLANDALRAFRSEFWSPRFYYGLTNDAFGPAQALTVQMAVSRNAVMAPTADVPGQAWYFTPLSLPLPGLHAMQNADAGATWVLEGAAPPIAAFMYSSSGGALPSGTIWYPEPAPAPGRFYLRNRNFSSQRVLEASLDQGVPFVRMELAAVTPGQYWTFRRLGLR